MADYQGMYLSLFRAVTDAVRLLQEAQLAAEEAYITERASGLCLLLSEAASAVKSGRPANGPASGDPSQ